MFIANILLRWLHWGDLLDSLLIWFCPNFSSISSFKSSTLLTAASYRGDWFWGLNWARAPPWGPIGQPPLHSHKIKVFGKFLQKFFFDCNETKAGGSEPYLKVNLHFQKMIGQGRLLKKWLSEISIENPNFSNWPLNLPQSSISSWSSQPSIQFSSPSPLSPFDVRGIPPKGETLEHGKGKLSFGNPSYGGIPPKKKQHGIPPTSHRNPSNGNPSKNLWCRIKLHL